MAIPGGVVSAATGTMGRNEAVPLGARGWRDDGTRETAFALAPSELASRGCSGKTKGGEMAQSKRQDDEMTQIEAHNPDSRVHTRIPSSEHKMGSQNNNNKMRRSATEKRLSTAPKRRLAPVVASPSLAEPDESPGRIRNLGGGLFLNRKSPNRTQ